LLFVRILFSQGTRIKIIHTHNHTYTYSQTLTMAQSHQYTHSQTHTHLHKHTHKYTYSLTNTLTMTQLHPYTHKHTHKHIRLHRHTRILYTYCCIYLISYLAYVFSLQRSKQLHSVQEILYDIVLVKLVCKHAFDLLLL
jgi:hypothetical protein